MDSLFEQYSLQLEAKHAGEENIRAVVKQIETVSRQADFLTNKQLSVLSVPVTAGPLVARSASYETDKAHVLSVLPQSSNLLEDRQDIVEFCQDCIVSTLTLTPVYTQLMEEVAKVGSAVQYKDFWRCSVNDLAASVLYFAYLASGELLSQEQLCQLLRLPEGMYLTIEDYLGCVVSLPQNLVRVAVNCVRAKLYTVPSKICTFVSDLNNGFKLMNLKNDNLRKRYDGIKYNVNRLETICFELEVRKLY